MSEHKTKLVRDLKVGDKVFPEGYSKPVKITRLTNGFYRNSTAIHWAGGHCCLHNDVECITKAHA